MVIGGVWVIWKFSIQRESHPKVEFDLDCEFIGNQDGQKIIQLTALVQNKGTVRHLINGKSFLYRIRYLNSSDGIVNGFGIKDKYGKIRKINQVNFYNSLVVNGQNTNMWVPNYSYTFIDPGVIQRYRVVVALPDNAEFLMVQSWFNYRDHESDEHSVQKVFSIGGTPKT